MDKQPIYVKFNSYRKPKFNMGTEIISSEKGYTVRKFAPQSEGRTFLTQLKTIHDLLVKSNLPLKVNSIKTIDKDTLEIEYIEGITLLNELKSYALNNSKEGCLEVFKNFSKLLDRFSTEGGYLSEDFEKVFGGRNMKKKYDLIIPGVLDLNLDNIVRDRDGKLTLIDFEWTFEFGIPKRYILYRSIYGSYIALRDMLSSVIRIEDIEKEFEFTNEDIKTYLSWEINFQNYVTGYKNDLATLWDTRKEMEIKSFPIEKKKTLEKKVKEIEEEKSILERKIETLEEGIEVLEEEKNALIPDALEFREFKQTKIWKGLSMYRKVKSRILKILKLRNH